MARWSKTFTPVMSDGSRSGVNWIREKRRVERAGERLDEHRLADPGKVLDDQVPLADEAEDDHPQGLLLRVDDARDVRDEPVDGLRRRVGVERDAG